MTGNWFLDWLLGCSKKKIRRRLERRGRAMGR